jgi:hypothetical protein
MMMRGAALGRRQRQWLHRSLHEHVERQYVKALGMLKRARDGTAVELLWRAATNAVVVILGG